MKQTINEYNHLILKHIIVHLSITTLLTMDSRDNNPVIFIDGSYFCFYRYHATLTWWKFSHSDQAQDQAQDQASAQDPSLNPEFIEKFKKSFTDSIASLPKKLGVSKDSIIVVGKDCKRSDIWRHEFAHNYKGTRPSNESISAFFAMVYNEELFLKGGCDTIIEHNRLEADDVIAISVKRLLAENTGRKIIIITSDKDYLQLLQPANNGNNNVVLIYNAAIKNIGVTKEGVAIDGHKELFIKTVMGDKSDNISSVIAKCGYKTAEKCYHNRDYFESRLEKEQSARQAYINNKKLVDFDEIPAILVAEFWGEHGAKMATL